MSNVIVNKNKWQEKPKTSKASEKHSKKYHKIKNQMLADGYTIEEIDKHFKNISKEEERISDEDIKELIIKYLPSLSKQQLQKVLKTIKEDLHSKKTSFIEKYLVKVASAIEK